MIKTINNILLIMAWTTIFKLFSEIIIISEVVYIKTLHRFEDNVRCSIFERRVS